MFCRCSKWRRVSWGVRETSETSENQRDQRDQQDHGPQVAHHGLGLWLKAHEVGPLVEGAGWLAVEPHAGLVLVVLPEAEDDDRPVIAANGELFKEEKKINIKCPKFRGGRKHNKLKIEVNPPPNLILEVYRKTFY